MATTDPRPLATSIEAYVKRDPETELPLLADDINELHRRVHRSAADALRYAFEAGELLHQAKALVAWGDWEAWLERHCTDVGMTIARIYMRLYTHRETVTSSGADSVRQALNVCAGLPNQTGLEQKRDEVRTLAQADPSLTRAALAERFGVSPTTVQLWLNPLSKQKAIERNQNAYRGKYKRKVIVCPHCQGKLHANGKPADG